MLQEHLPITESKLIIRCPPNHADRSLLLPLLHSHRATLIHFSLLNLLSIDNNLYIAAFYLLSCSYAIISSLLAVIPLSLVFNYSKSGRSAKDMLSIVLCRMKNRLSTTSSLMR